MPTVSRTWVFTADTEGLVDVGDSANIPVNWDSVPKMLEFGPAAGGANDTERARGPVTSGKDWTVLFPGLPAGAVVTSVQCSAWNYQRFNIGSLTAWRVRMRIVDSAGVSVHSAGELIDFTDNAPAVDGAKQTGTAPGTSRAVDAAKRAAATIVALELQYNRTGGAASNDIDFDDIAITVTYTTGSDDTITTLYEAAAQGRRFHDRAFPAQGFSGHFVKPQTALAKRRIGPAPPQATNPNLNYTFDGGADGASVTIGQQGCGDRWDVVSLGANAAFLYDRTNRITGAEAGECSTGITSTTAYGAWTTKFGTQTDHYGRVYLYLTATPAASQLVRVLSGGAQAACITINTAAKIQLADQANATQATSVSAIPLNQWVRIDFHFVHDAAVGQIVAKLFTDPDSLTPAETVQTAAAINTLASATEIRFGITGGQANVTAFWIDELNSNVAGFPGPISRGIPTLEQMKPRVTLAAVRARREQPRRALPGWYEPAQTKVGVGGAATATYNGVVANAGSLARSIGPRPPAAVTTAPLPTREQRTVRVSCAAAARRLTERRRFPLQGWGGTILQSGVTAGPVTTKFGALQRFLGPRAPRVVVSPATEEMRRLKLRLQAVQRRVTELRRFPLQGWGGMMVFRATAGTDEFDQLQRGQTARRLGPRPAGVVSPVPSLRMQTITVQRVAQARRNTERRRFPLQGVEGSQTQTTADWLGRVFTAGAFERLIGPEPPEKVAAPAQPTLREQQTVRVRLMGRTRVEANRRSPHFVLRPPAVVDALRPVGQRGWNGPQWNTQLWNEGPPTLRQQTISVRLVAAAARLARPPRPPRSFLLPPTVVTPAVVTTPVVRFISTTVAGLTRASYLLREPHAHVYPPTIVAPRPPPTDRQQTLAVAYVAVRTRVEFVRRAPHVRLEPPTAILPLPSRDMTTLRLTLALRPRVELSRRAPHLRLSPPTVLQVFPGPQVTLAAVRTRADAQRRAPHQRLAPPTALQTFAGPRVELAAVGTRLSLLRRGTHAKAAPPTAVLPLPTLRAQTISVTTATRPEIERQRRAPHLRLAPPAELAPVKTTLTVYLADVAARLSLRRRGTRYYLAAPTVVAAPSLAPPLAAALAAVRNIAAFQRRAPHSKLRPPAAVAPTPLPLPEQRTLRVVLGGRTRVEEQRRAPHWLLSKPAVLQTFAGPAVTLTAVAARLSLRRRGTRSDLFAPAVISPAPLAPPLEATLADVRSRSAFGRRAPRSTLRPPVVVNPTPLPLPEQRTLRVVLGGRNRVELVRRAPSSLLSPPTTTQPVVPPFAPVTVDLARIRVDRRPPKSKLRLPTAVLPLPTLRAQTVSVTLAAVSTRTSLRRREPLVLYTTTNLRPPPLKAGTTKVTLAVLATRASVRRRGPRTFYLGTNLRPPPLKAGTTKVTLVAVKTRAELVRHTLSFLRPPVLEQEPPEPPETGVGVGGGGLPPEGQRGHQILDHASQAVEENEDEEIAMLIALDLI